jgi:hypothetical protein
MSCEAHVRFCEHRGVRFPPATRLVVMVAGTRAHAEALTDQVAAVLAAMGLRLSEAKTSIRHIDQGVDFLGFRIQRHQQRGSTRRYVYTYPSKKALAAVKATVRTLTTTMRNQPLKVLLHRLNGVRRAGPPTSATGHRRRPSTTCAPSPGGGWWAGCAASTRAPAGSSCAAATCRGGGRRRVRCGCSTPVRSRSSATATGAPGSPHRGPAARKDHPRAPTDADWWRARCAATRPAGSEARAGEPGHCESTAPRSGPTLLRHGGQPGRAALAWDQAAARPARHRAEPATGPSPV